MPAHENPDDPLYTHHSDHLVSFKVPVKLNDMNYSKWSRSFVLQIKIRNKLAFLNGSIKCPPEEDTEAHVAWTKCDQLVLGWILSSISDDLADNLAYVTTAHEAWERLRLRYAQANTVRIYQLIQEINSLV